MWTNAVLWPAFSRKLSHAVGSRLKSQSPNRDERLRGLIPPHARARLTTEEGFLQIGHAVFRDQRKRILPAECTVHEAEYVTLTFVDKKNGEKMDVRTQQRTVNDVLCPVKQAHALVSWI
jgi:hypothetical protein